MKESLTLHSEIVQGLSSEVFALTISALVALVISFVVQGYYDRPRIRGNVFSVLNSTIVGNFGGPQQTYAGYLIYLYVTNLHKNSIFIADYQGAIDFGDGYIKLQRFYGDVDRVFQPGQTATPPGPNPNNYQFPMNLLKGKLMYKQNKPVAYGDFLDGFVLFFGNPSLLQYSKMKRVRITCIDVTGKKHVFKTDSSKFDLSLMMDRFPDQLSVPGLIPSLPEKSILKRIRNYLSLHRKPSNP